MKQVAIYSVSISIVFVVVVARSIQHAHPAAQQTSGAFPVSYNVRIHQQPFREPTHQISIPDIMHDCQPQAPLC
jgi:hypothetical protein